MNFIQKYLGQYALQMLIAMTPALLDICKVAALSIYEKAQKTDNPYDNVGADFLLQAVGVSPPDQDQDPIPESDQDQDPDPDLIPGLN